MDHPKPSLSSSNAQPLFHKTIHRRGNTTIKSNLDAGLFLSKTPYATDSRNITVKPSTFHRRTVSNCKPPSSPAKSSQTRNKLNKTHYITHLNDSNNQQRNSKQVNIVAQSLRMGQQRGTPKTTIVSPTLSNQGLMFGSKPKIKSRRSGRESSGHDSLANSFYNAVMVYGNLNTTNVQIGNLTNQHKKPNMSPPARNKTFDQAYENPTLPNPIKGKIRIKSNIIKPISNKATVDNEVQICKSYELTEDVFFFDYDFIGKNFAFK